MRATSIHRSSPAGRLFHPLFAGVLLLSLALPASAANKVISVGDSWGAFLPPFMDTQFNVNGNGDYDVLNIAVPGATADAYANNFGGVLSTTLTTIQITAEAEYVFLSLGGNDLFGRYGSEGAGVFGAIEQDIEFVVQQILAADPDIEIVMAGYDVLKLDKSPFCLAFGLQTLGTALPWEATPLMLEIGTRQAAIAARNPRTSYVSLWGTGQGNPGNPNLLQWSPGSYVAADDADCLHLSNSGHTTFAGELYDQYWKPRLGGGGGCNAAVTGDDSSGPLGVFGFVLAPVALAAWRRRRA